MSVAETTTTTATVPGPRLRDALIQFPKKSLRERADFVLFIAGLAVEYALLLALLSDYARRGEVVFWNYIVMTALCVGLAIHQLLIFRNSALQYALPGSHLALFELVICLFFGVLTGELGYLLVLAICFEPEWLLNVPIGAGWVGAVVILVALTALQLFLSRRAGDRLVSKRMFAVLAGSLAVIALSAFYLDRNDFAIRSSSQGLQWAFADYPLVIAGSNTQGVADGGGLALSTIQWFAHALGRALKAVFASGAMLLSGMILMWDVLAWDSFGQSAATASNANDCDVRKRSYRTTIAFFFGMDGLALFTWAMVLGVLLPKGLIFKPTGCFSWLTTVSFLYLGLAILRLAKARETIHALSSPEAAATTVI